MPARRFDCLGCDPVLQRLSGPQTVNYTLASATDSLCVSNANDTNTIDSSFSMFSNTGWILGDKAGDESGGDGVIFFTDSPTAGETSPGSWAINLDAFALASQVVVTLKQADSFAAFLVDATSGTWTTAGPGGSAMGLSHGSVYYLADGRNPGPPPVPLPAALPLLLSAFGGLGFFGWRRRAVKTA